MDSQIAQLLGQLSFNEVHVQQLLWTNEGLRREIDRLRSLQVSRLSQPCLLLNKLPRELRDIIWGFCVAPGKYFVKPRPLFDARYNDMDEYFEPAWQLFLVNRLVRKEAMKAFFEKNQIVVNDYPECPLILKRTKAVGKVQALSSLSPEHLTFLSVSFDPRGLYGAGENPLIWAECLREPLPPPNASWTALTAQERMRFAHDTLITTICCTWTRLLAHATGTWPESPSALRELQVDVTNCYCRQGCCRVVGSPAWSLAQCRFGKSLKKIEILGTKTRAERDMFVDALLGSAEESLAICQPKLIFKAFDLESRSNELRTLDMDGLDTQLGDEEVDLGSRWEQHLLDTAGG